MYIHVAGSLYGVSSPFFLTRLLYTCSSCSLADSPLPKSKRSLLKWKMSTITPNVVKMCIARVGFSECTSKKTVNHIPSLPSVPALLFPPSCSRPPPFLYLPLRFPLPSIPTLLFPPSSIPLPPSLLPSLLPLPFPGSMLMPCS